MKELNDFFEDIYSDDIIYHYTKASTAIDYILFDKRLKLTYRKDSIDPIEKFPSYRITSDWYGVDKELDEMHQRHWNDITKMKKNLKNRINSFVQVCFCKNNIQAEGFSNFSSQQEDFGFAKPRMWEQYGDNYTGVCIAFSKKKIIEKNNNLDLIKEKTADADYLTYSELFGKTAEINLNAFDKIGREKYEKILTDRIDNELFWKHKDYIDENEYKICTLFDKEKSCLNILKDQLCDYMGLNIEKCVEAIFISSYANENQKTVLHKYSKELNVPLIEIKWNSNGIDIKDYDKQFNFIEKLKKRHEN